jgi:hypothetical protein
MYWMTQSLSGYFESGQRYMTLNFAPIFEGQHSYLFQEQAIHRGREH